MVQRIRRRVGLSVAFVALIVLIGVQPVAGASVVSQSGSIGLYSLTDRATPAGQQGATCAYRLATYKLATITVRHPLVKARNRTTARDSQWIGWQYVVQHATPSSTTFQAIYTSTIVKARAYDNLAASLSDRTWTGPVTPTGKYRVQIVLRWYTPGSSTTVQGTVRLQAKHYESTWNGNAIISPDYCLQDY